MQETCIPLTQAPQGNSPSSYLHSGLQAQSLRFLQIFYLVACIIFQHYITCFCKYFQLGKENPYQQINKRNPKIPSNYFKIIDKNHDKLELKKLSYKNEKESKRKT